MKYTLLSSLLFLIGLMGFVSQSQAQSSRKGNIAFTGGLTYFDGIAPATLSGEYLVTDEIGVGLHAWYHHKEQTSSYYVGVRGNYHVSKLLKIRNSKIDLVGGLVIGQRTEKTTGFGFASDPFHSILYQLIPEGRYSISDHVGVYGNFTITASSDLGSTSFALGVVVKL